MITTTDLRRLPWKLQLDIITWCVDRNIDQKKCKTMLARMIQGDGDRDPASAWKLSMDEHQALMFAIHFNVGLG